MQTVKTGAFSGTNPAYRTKRSNLEDRRRDSNRCSASYEHTDQAPRSRSNFGKSVLECRDRCASPNGGNGCKEADRDQYLHDHRSQEEVAKRINREY
jgi:hypothetical protein